jgi:hypothetical protein
MRSTVSPELVTALLEVAGVPPGTTRAESAAAWVSAQLQSAGPACDALAFEDEPAGLVAEMRERAP